MARKAVPSAPRNIAGRVYLGSVHCVASPGPGLLRRVAWSGVTLQATNASPGPGLLYKQLFSESSDSRECRVLSVKFVLYGPSSSYPIAPHCGDADFACPTGATVCLHPADGADTLERSGSRPVPLSSENHSIRSDG
jgi:hypothetical protein